MSPAATWHRRWCCSDGWTTCRQGGSWSCRPPRKRPEMLLRSTCIATTPRSPDTLTSSRAAIDELKCCRHMQCKDPLSRCCSATPDKQEMRSTLLKSRNCEGAPRYQCWFRENVPQQLQSIGGLGQSDVTEQLLIISVKAVVQLPVHCEAKLFPFSPPSVRCLLAGDWTGDGVGRSPSSSATSPDSGLLGGPSVAAARWWWCRC